MIQTIDVKESIFRHNQQEADELRTSLRERGCCLINLMSSPGSGKTSTLLALFPKLKGRLAIGVMEADIDATVDAEAVQNAGVRSVQLHTGGMCHLDAAMTRQGLEALGTEGLDLIILENVGNLVCPAEFDTGAHRNVSILSVPEGDDKPLKYPLMYEVCDLLVINKIDVLPCFDFDRENVERYAKQRNPRIKLIWISAKTGEGVDELADWFLEQAEAVRKG